LWCQLFFRYFSLYDEVSRNCTLIIIQFRDMFLCVMYAYTDSDYVKFAQDIVRVLHCCHCHPDPYCIAAWDPSYRCPCCLGPSSIQGTFSNLNRSAKIMCIYLYDCFHRVICLMVQRLIELIVCMCRVFEKMQCVWNIVYKSIVRNTVTVNLWDYTGCPKKMYTHKVNIPYFMCIHLFGTPCVW
jgi:hypothetical protein